ncbi:nuclear transport factor 2 family protein [Pseudorhizobium endolithicum]|uniref:Nuclear transport factor 2 family protein n=1 Tax=Pseudorhizobium endolithicum TaxID=1191678 RepID=A0ABM8PD98_9HYPH|nr:nuclear transport factor 2 family protein [Pseudorhizobium endolithicum]CAD7023580.1 nuclear transport factor 2 family protein [Pseudorhizobium endolithicum]
MTDHLAIANAYLALWTEADDDARTKALAEGWAADARYTDPLMQGEGPAGISAMIAAARTHFPGHRFKLTGTPDGHGPFTRFSWALVSPAGETVARGMDVARVDAAGRVKEVVGFLEG